MNFKHILLCFFLFPIFADHALAEGPALEQRLLDAGDNIAVKVDKAAEAIDVRLAGKKYIKKPNPSSINITQLVSWSEGGVVRDSTDFGVNLRLPNVEKRFQLRFSSYNEEQESRDLTQQRVRVRPRDKEYAAGFMFFQRLGKVRTSFQPRLQLKDPLDVSYILRFESSSEIKPFRLAPRLDLFADARKGTGEYFSLEFNYDLNERTGLTLVNSEEYREKENYFTTQHGITIDHGLTKTQGVGAAVTTSANNKPNYHMDTVTLSASYSQLIYVQRLTYSVTPFLLFAKGAHFKGNAGITLSVDLIF